MGGMPTERDPSLPEPYREGDIEIDTGDLSDLEWEDIQ